MELICEKGIGKTHAKWCPVCTAFYRLRPDIRLSQPVTNDDARDLVKLCPMGVFDIEDLGKGKVQATVKDASKCSTCRECVRHDRFAEKVDLGKEKDVFEFHIETVGIYKPETLLKEALSLLKAKATKWLDALRYEESLLQQTQD